jgi:hypothetical protein
MSASPRLVCRCVSPAFGKAPLMKGLARQIADQYGWLPTNMVCRKDFVK